MDVEMPKLDASFAGLPLSPMTMCSSHNNSIQKRVFYFAQMMLRVLVIAFTLAGAIIMATSKQSVTFFGIVMDARYSYSSAFRFLVVADSVVCGFAVLSVVLVIWLNSPKSKPKDYFYLLVHDLVSVLLLLSGCSSAMAIGYVGRNGQTQTGWIAICDRVPKFCDKVMVSIVSSFLAFICLFFLTVLSAYKLKSHAYLEGGI